ncbi:YggT family protein [Candidatus Spongiihabitans sp.]|uniref:YggT family protein n=1 Tax=Candidatus Spongiihabitans sp. TaxID=3101308 RepID=UPI003C7ECBE7
MPYLQNALNFVIETIVGLYLTAVILRFLFQLLQVDFRNPISRFIIIATSPPLKILRRFIPGLYGMDLSVVALILIIGLIKTGLLLALSGYPFNIPGTLVITLAEVLNTIAWTFIIVIIGSAILSWVAPVSQHPVAHLINSMSHPLIRPFRKILPPIQGLDLSPLLALLALNLIQRLVILPITDFGRSFFF